MQHQLFLLGGTTMTPAPAASLWRIMLCLLLAAVLVAAASDEGGVTSSSSLSYDWDHRIADTLKEVEASLLRQEEINSKLSSFPSDIILRTDDDDDDEDGDGDNEQEQVDKQKIDSLIHRINQKQLHDFIKELERIAEHAEKVVMAHKSSSSTTTLIDDDAEAATTTTNTSTSGGVSMDDLNDMFDAKKLLKNSDTQLAEWILSLLEEQVEDILMMATEEEDVDEDVDAEVDVETSEAAASAASSSCVTTLQAAQEVQEALDAYRQDGIGQYDYALQENGSSSIIVHSMTTAITYQPNGGGHNNNNNLGTSQWRQYIPQDWEDWLLPKNWEFWNVPTIPDHIFHSLGIISTSATTAMTTAPPETILQSRIHPGSCWPISMRSTSTSDAASSPFAAAAAPSPVVVIRLSQTISVTAITIDHASSLLLTSPSEQLRSAPKRLKIYGYEPCHDDNEDNKKTSSCSSGVGFDVTSKLLLANIEYDIEGESNIQTFDIANTAAAAAASNIKGDGGSCSAVSAESCGSGGDDDGFDMPVAAIAVEIVENWGNPNYTCLYRVRVHGEPVD